MSNIALGQVITGDAHRDAIHVAIAPITAPVDLYPGQHVGKDGNPDGTHVAIVDPFLTHKVQKGDQVYLCLYPNTVTSLRHEWTHPAFEATENQQSASEQWLRNFAIQVDAQYDVMMEGAGDYVTSMRNSGYGEYLIQGGRWEGVSVPDEFWTHYEAVTGDKVENDHRGTFFSCSC